MTMIENYICLGLEDNGRQIVKIMMNMVIPYFTIRFILKKEIVDG